MRLGIQSDAGERYVYSNTEPRRIETFAIDIKTAPQMHHPLARSYLIRPTYSNLRVLAMYLRDHLLDRAKYDFRLFGCNTVPHVFNHG